MPLCLRTRAVFSRRDALMATLAGFGFTSVTPPQAQAAGLTKQPMRIETVKEWGKRYFYLPLVVSIPDTLRVKDGKVDAVIHFHGAHFLQEEALRTSKLNAVSISINLGISTESYSNFVFSPKGSPNALERILAKTQDVIRAAFGDVAIGRVALAAWSAGFGAVRPMLALDEIRKRADAILIADGMFAGLSSVQKRIVHTEPLAGMIAFAESATRSEKLFITTHSQITAESYASVAETTTALLAILGISKTASARASQGGSEHAMLYDARKGLFTAAGYGGIDKAAHIAQIKQMGTVMYAPLKAHWERAEEPPAARDAQKSIF
jgi:hypothetical protein